jgi:hypothetical protein
VLTWSLMDHGHQPCQVEHRAPMRGCRRALCPDNLLLLLLPVSVVVVLVVVAVVQLVVACYFVELNLTAE